MNEFIVENNLIAKPISEKDGRMMKFGENGKSLDILVNNSDRCHLELNPALNYFYAGENLSENGSSLAGSLHRDGEEYQGYGQVSIFDVVYKGLATGLNLHPEKKDQRWAIIRKDNIINLELENGAWKIRSYQGNEPDWNFYEFPFSGLPESTPESRHAFIRGLLDFFGGTRRSPQGIVYQCPNTSGWEGGYGMDGIPDTFFHFMSTYPYLSKIRRSYWFSQIKWLGDNMRHDGCIPWGGCNQDKPYYHLWNSPKYGLFFDGNALWLEMIYQLWKQDGVEPDLSLVIRAADFYLHYMADGLVAAESKKAGCEWADLLQNGWHSSLINVLACRGLNVTSEILESFGMQELAERYSSASDQLRKRLNSPVSKGGLWNPSGYIDWRDKDGTIHPHWRIDTHMLAIIFEIPDDEQLRTIWNEFDRIYFDDEPKVPAPYLLYGSWETPVDDMLEGCRAFGCGKASMMGRMGGSLAAALYRCGREEKAQHIFNKLVDLVNSERSVYEKYDEKGNGSGAISYIEHALSPLLATAFRKL